MPSYPANSHLMKNSIFRIFILILFVTCPLFAEYADMKEFAEYAYLSQYKSVEISRTANATGKEISTDSFNIIILSIRD